MNYAFYTAIKDGKGRIEAILSSDSLTEEQKVKGVPVTDIPELEARPGYVTVLYVDLLNRNVTAEYELPETSLFGSYEHRLQEAENKLKTPSEYYKVLNLAAITLDELKTAKIEALKDLCNQSIASGFTSASTGFKIGFTDTDQRNIANQVILFLANPSKVDCDWKTEDAGIQKFTKETFMQIPLEGESHTRANIGKLWMLVAKVNAAGTKEAVHAIGW